MDQSLCTLILSKILEQIERTDRLTALLPENQLDWKPDLPNAFSAGVLLGHLLECLAGFCAVLHAVHPDRLHHFSELRSLPINHRCNQAEAKERMAAYAARIQEGFSLLHDSELNRLIPTVFIHKGEPLLTLLLGNIEHLVNHKHQLFTYLQLMGINIGSKDLYRFRGE